jgi:hypothetical protein
MSKLKPTTFTVAAIVALAQIGLAQKEIPMSTEKGNITLILKGFAPDVAGGVRLQGSIRNDTPFKFKNVMFDLNGYDANGKNVNLCGTDTLDGGCTFELFDAIEPGQTLPIRYPGEFVQLNESRTVSRAEYKVKEAPYFIKYDIQADPVENEEFVITPSFDLKGIRLDFRNKSPDVIEVAWDQCVYIDENGNSSRLIRGNVNLAEKDRPQPNTVIPPGSKLQETVFPVDRVQQEDGKWTQQPILPDTAWIFDRQFLDKLRKQTTWVHHVYLPGAKELTGKSVRLFLRLLVNDQKQNVTVSFKIVNMIQ